MQMGKHLRNLHTTQFTLQFNASPRQWLAKISKRAHSEIQQGPNKKRVWNSGACLRVQKNGISNGARTSPKGLNQITIIPALEFYVCSEARTCCLVGWVFRPRKEAQSWRTKRIFCYMYIHSRHKNQIALISTRISASLSGQPTNIHIFFNVLIEKQTNLDYAAEYF